MGIERERSGEGINELPRKGRLAARKRKTRGDERVYRVGRERELVERGSGQRPTGGARLTRVHCHRVSAADPAVLNSRKQTWRMEHARENVERRAPNGKECV